jgi:lipoprotein-anchoring transpeptidase ErfK/SrfK
MNRIVCETRLTQLALVASLALPFLSPRLKAQEATSSTPAVLQPVTPATTTALPANVPRAENGVLELRASVNNRVLYVIRGDSLLAEYPVAVGADGYPTPRGNFLIKKIIWNPRWVPPDADWAKGKTAKAPGSPANPMKVVKIFFRDPDYYIHGTDAVESLGQAASHGCLRMDPDQAAAVARIIMENGGQPHEESWFWRVLHFRREEKTVYLDNPIKLVIGD